MELLSHHSRKYSALSGSLIRGKHRMIQWNMSHDLLALLMRQKLLWPLSNRLIVLGHTTQLASVLDIHMVLFLLHRTADGLTFLNQGILNFTTFARGPFFLDFKGVETYNVKQLQHLLKIKYQNWNIGCYLYNLIF